MEPYLYVGNNPVNFIDPTGMEAENPDTIFPRLVKQDKDGNVISKPNTFTKKFHRQMGEFMSTDIGKSYISRFMKKGEVFMGYTASENGKFSNYDLKISDMHITDPSARGVYMRGEGSFSYGIDEKTGKLYFNLKIDSNMSPDKILETIGHELMLHGYKAKQLIDYFEKNGKDNFIDAMRNGKFPSGNSDYKAIRDWDCSHEGLNNYESFMNETINRNKEMKKLLKMKKIIIMKLIKGANVMFLFLLFSCTEKKINLYDNENNDIVKALYLGEEIEIVFENNLKGNIILKKNGKNEYKLVSQKLMFLSKSLTLRDSIILSNKTFYKNFMIKDEELDNNIIYSSYIFKINDEMFVSKISFSLTPLYCLKIYYDSNFMIKKMYFQYGDKNINVKINKEVFVESNRYNEFLGKVQHDSLKALKEMNHIEEW